MHQLFAAGITVPNVATIAILTALSFNRYATPLNPLRGQGFVFLGKIFLETPLRMYKVTFFLSELIFYFIKYFFLT